MEQAYERRAEVREASYQAHDEAREVVHKVDMWYINDFEGPDEYKPFTGTTHCPLTYCWCGWSDKLEESIARFIWHTGECKALMYKWQPPVLSVNAETADVRAEVVQCGNLTSERYCDQHSFLR